jgi:DNA-directed RNA polymerase specialized sigma24 family protein
VTVFRAVERLHTAGEPVLDPAGCFGEVFDAYFGAIHRYTAARWLRPYAAADVAAQAFLEAFRQRGRYDQGRAGVRTWLYGIATKVIGPHQRDAARTLRALARVGPGQEGGEHADRVDSRVSARALRTELARAIGALPRGQRDVWLCQPCSAPG